MSSSSSSSLSLCNSTPNPDSCLKALKFSININPSIPTFLLQTLKLASSEASKLSSLLQSTPIIENQRSTLQDCRELHQITISCLRKSTTFSLSLSRRKISDVRTCLSAALTNRATCIEGLTSASGPFKETLISAVEDGYKPISNAIALLSRVSPRRPAGGRRLSNFPFWLSHRDRKTLQSSNGGSFCNKMKIFSLKDNSKFMKRLTLQQMTVTIRTRS